MIKKFERLTGELEEISFDKVEENEATHIHYCGHDTNPPTPCKRVKIK